MPKKMVPKDDNDELLLVNAVEVLVRQMVAEEIEKMDMCRCEKCMFNACAIALNALTPHYVTTTRGKILSECDALSIEYRANMVMEVTKALIIVKEHPMHEMTK